MIFKTKQTGSSYYLFRPVRVEHKDTTNGEELIPYGYNGYLCVYPKDKTETNFYVYRDEGCNWLKENYTLETPTQEEIEWYEACRNNLQ